MPRVNTPIAKSSDTGYRNPNLNPNINKSTSLTRTSRNTGNLKELENLKEIRASLKFRMSDMFSHVWNISKSNKPKPIMPKKEYYDLRLELREIEGKAIRNLRALSSVKVNI